jgi:Flp pilus assembly pilin Flp
MRKNKSLSSLEYAMLISMVVLALLASFHYLKNAISGRMKSSADTFGFGRQYQYPSLK